MKRKITLLMMVGVICVFLGSYNEGRTEEKNDRWVYYGTTKEGRFFYDKYSVKKVSPKIIRVWDMLNFKTDKTLPSKNDNKRLENQISLHEFDCGHNKRKFIKYISYNKGGRIIENYENPNSKMHPIPPGSIYEILQNKICNK